MKTIHPCSFLPHKRALGPPTIPCGPSIISKADAWLVCLFGLATRSSLSSKSIGAAHAVSVMASRSKYRQAQQASSCTSQHTLLCPGGTAMKLAALHPRTSCQPSTSGTAPPIHTSDVHSPSKSLAQLSLRLILNEQFHQNICSFQINSIPLQQIIASRVAMFAHQPANYRRQRW